MQLQPDGASAVLWPTERGPQRGPKPSLTRGRIVAVAIDLADEQGLERVTVQLVAQRLERPKMSLYRYFPGRDELVALMADTALGDPPVLHGRGWRSRLRDWARQAWPVFLAHPWLHRVTLGPRVFGPNELGWLESALGALADTGLRSWERLDAVALVNGHLRSMAAQQSAGHHSASGEPADAGMEARSVAMMQQVLADNADRFPLAAAAFADAARTGDTDRALEFGLERILDGLAKLIGRRQGG